MPDSWRKITQIVARKLRPVCRADAGSGTRVVFQRDNFQRSREQAEVVLPAV